MRKKVNLSNDGHEVVRKMHNCLMPMFRSKPGWPQHITRTGKSIVAAIAVDCVPGVTQDNIRKLFKILTEDPLHAIKINRGRFLLSHRVYYIPVKQCLEDNNISIDLKLLKEPGASGLLEDGPAKERVTARKEELKKIREAKDLENKKRLRDIKRLSK